MDVEVLPPFFPYTATGLLVNAGQAFQYGQYALHVEVVRWYSESFHRAAAVVL